MKTAQLPPVRVEPSVREEIESVLREGETLSQFVESAAVEAAQRRPGDGAWGEGERKRRHVLEQRPRTAAGGAAAADLQVGPPTAALLVETRLTPALVSWPTRS